MNRRKGFGIVFGLILVAVGVLCALNGFGMEINISLDGWWTLFIILPCIGGLFTDKDKLGSLLGLALGIFLFLAARNVIPYGMIWKQCVPILVVCIGIKLIFQSFRGEANTSENTKKEENEEGKTECMAAFCSRESNCSDENIKLAKIGAVFGGAKCNLSEAKFTEKAELDIFCAFGGAEVIVPENVELKINAFCLFGGVTDKRAVKKTEEACAVLEVNGFCLFGGADLK